MSAPPPALSDEVENSVDGELEEAGAAVVPLAAPPAGDESEDLGDNNSLDSDDAIMPNVRRKSAFKDAVAKIHVKDNGIFTHGPLESAMGGNKPKIIQALLIMMTEFALEESKKSDLEFSRLNASKWVCTAEFGLKWNTFLYEVGWYQLTDGFTCPWLNKHDLDVQPFKNDTKSRVSLVKYLGLAYKTKSDRSKWRLDWYIRAMFYSQGVVAKWANANTKKAPKTAPKFDWVEAFQAAPVGQVILGPLTEGAEGAKLKSLITRLDKKFTAHRNSIAKVAGTQKRGRNMSRSKKRRGPASDHAPAAKKQCTTSMLGLIAELLEQVKQGHLPDHIEEMAADNIKNILMANINK